MINWDQSLRQQQRRSPFLHRVPPSSRNRAQFWRARAEMIRLFAERVGNPDAKQALQAIADDYNRCARESETY